MTNRKTFCKSGPWFTISVLRFGLGLGLGLGLERLVSFNITDSPAEVVLTMNSGVAHCH